MLMYFIMFTYQELILQLKIVDAWNKHPIRTERNWTPEQIWCNGMMNRVNERLAAVADVRGEGEMGDDDLQ